MRLLAERASQHAQRGELAAARGLYEDILSLEPANPEALSFIAMSVLQAGDLRGGVQRLERAVELNPANANLLKNLGIAYRAAGNREDALKAFERAAELKPDLVAALFNHGALLEELGRRDEALARYMRGFEAAEASGLFLDVAAIPAGIRVLAEKAMVALRDARMEVFRAALAPVEREHGRATLGRVWYCLESYLGLRPPIPLPELQRPTFMSFPGLPARAWYERSEFPWMAELESHTGEIREELLAMLAREEGFRPFVEMPREHPGAAYWRELNHSPNWNAFFFYRDGMAFADNHARCPHTIAALDAAPLNRVADHSPEALYSVLTPGAHIPPHTGVINVRLVVHLPLIVPSTTECGIRVGTETRHWTEGQCIAFDDTFEHEAWNRSGKTRVVMIFDIWNPALTLAEREGMRAAIEELGRFNRAHGGKHQSLA
ncbi:MAG TPA: aspartyl/asparaginyl beta-hydroxylase domain-containing protein [Gammaproteobacteria bacterium]|nr:aspartyl/asparaginyl beta-hydroxylase domain-containing protein [Gammaproteobacteria bacterium]